MCNYLSQAIELPYSLVEPKRKFDKGAKQLHFVCTAHPKIATVIWHWTFGFFFHTAQSAVQFSAVERISVNYLDLCIDLLEQLLPLPPRLFILGTKTSRRYIRYKCYYVTDQQISSPCLYNYCFHCKSTMKCPVAI